MGQRTIVQPIGFPATLADELLRIGSTRAYQCFAACWMGAAAYLLLTPHRQTVFIASIVGLIGLIHWLFTLRFVPPTPPDTPVDGAPEQRWRLWSQFAVILLVIKLTTLGGLAFHKVIAPVTVPGWSALMELVAGWAKPYMPSPNFVLNPLQYAVLPMVLLLLLGAGWRELGFARGHYSLRMIVIWSFEAIGALLVILLLRQMTGLALLRVLGSHALQNGFMEEFLFRGALQTRLVRLFDPAWGLVLSALVFGLWHIGLSISATDGDLMAGIARSILLQGSMGLVFGYIYGRTRNLLAPSFVHILTNAAPF